MTDETHETMRVHVYGPGRAVLCACARDVRGRSLLLLLLLLLL